MFGFVWLQIVFCPCLNETTLFSLRSLLRESDSFPKIFIKKQTRRLIYKINYVFPRLIQFPVSLQLEPDSRLASYSSKPLWVSKMPTLSQFVWILVFKPSLYAGFRLSAVSMIFISTVSLISVTVLNSNTEDDATDFKVSFLFSLKFRNTKVFYKEKGQP